MAVTPTLQDLIGQLPGQLGQGMMSPAEQQAAIDQIVAATMPAALRKYGDTAQSIAESNFGRGMGLSSYNAYQQALNTLMQNEGAAQIQNQAQQSVDAAQRAAVGQAAQYANAGQNRAAQEAAQKRGISAQNSAQNKAAIIGGLGNLGMGTAATLGRDLMRPSNQESGVGNAWGRIKEGMGFGANKSNMAPNMSEGTTGGNASDYNMGDIGYSGNTNLPSFDLNTGGSTDFGTGNLSDYSFNLPSFQMPDFSLDSLFGGINYLPGDFWDQSY